MKIAISKSHSPYTNLAIEEIILKDNDINEDVILFYINQNTIVVGRNQNVHEEINHQYVKDNNIKVIRRISGGGTVYHDLGNINFSFITQKNNRSYEKFLTPIIEFLRTLGLTCNFKGKNDLEVNGFKVSGNAQYIWKDRMFHHGTLLFDSNLQVLSQALKPNKLKLESKAIKSARQRVSNIRPLLKADLTPEAFLEKLIKFFTEENSTLWDLANYKPNEIEELAKQRTSEEWNYGKNPSFSFKNSKRFGGGTINLNLNFDNNKISGIKIAGDFLSRNNFEEIYSHFIDLSYNDDIIANTINKIDNFSDYLGKITKLEFISLFKENL